MNTPKNKNSENIIQRGILLFYKIFVKPFSENEDHRRRELLLNVILSGFNTFLIILFVLVLFSYFGENYAGIAPSLFIFIALPFFVLHLLSRAKHFLAAAYLFVAIFWLATTYGAYAWGIDLPQVLLSYGMTIVFAGILISSRFSFIVSVATAITLILLGYLEINSLIAPATEWRKEKLAIDDPIGFAAMLFLITLVSWLYNRELERSLEQVKQSEAALEVKVEERTRELKEAQLEKMSHFYRFAEFGKLASGLFHDLMSPLTAVSMNMEKLKGTEHPEMVEAGKYLDKTMQATQKLQGLIDSVRKQMQNEDVEEYFSLNEEVEQAIAVLGYKTRRNKVSVEFYAEDELQTYGNPLKFYQVAMNLISNAVDAHDDSQNRESRNAFVTLKESAGQIYFKVEDNGCGILPEHLNKIFEPFFTTKTPDRGTGIGLVTVKEIVEKNFGGDINAASMPEKGSIFVVTFPKRDSPAEK